MRQHQVLIHVHVVWFDESQLGPSLPHYTDGPVGAEMETISALPTRWHHTPVA